MAERQMVSIPVPAGQREKKPEDDKPKIGVKKPKKKTDLMDLDVKRKKEEGDFSAVVDKAIPEQVALAKSGKVSEAVENLYGLEKQCRNGGDAFSTAKVVTCIVELLWESNDFKGLIENLQMLTKKRGQLKQAVTSMVQKAVTFVDRLSLEKDLDKKLELIDTLRTITEGKIYVENERARLTMILAKIRESQGKVKEAADIMQEIQVETYGSMEKREKTEFILEQVRLCLDSGDFIRAQIISRKINPRILLDAGFEDIKLTYYTLMVRYWTQQANYLEIAKSYQAMYDTPKVKQNPDLWKKNLKSMVLFLTLSPFNNEQSDFINRVQLDKQLEELPLEQNLVRLFLTKELMAWPKLEQLYKGEFSTLGAKVWEDFHHRVVEHNIRVIATYYTRISMTRLSQLLYLSIAETEKFVSDQVVSKGVFARIDRPRGVINFVKRQEPAEVMDEWAHNVGELLELVEKTCHLIARENMVHAAAEKAAATTKTA